MQGIASGTGEGTHWHHRKALPSRRYPSRNAHHRRLGGAVTQPQRPRGGVTGEGDGRERCLLALDRGRKAHDVGTHGEGWVWGCIWSRSWRRSRILTEETASKGMKARGPGMFGERGAAGDDGAKHRKAGTRTAVGGPGSSCRTRR